MLVLFVCIHVPKVSQTHLKMCVWLSLSRIRSLTVEILAVHASFLCACIHVPFVFPYASPKRSYSVCLGIIKKGLKFDQNPFTNSGDIGCARQLSPCVHTHEKFFPNKFYCVCLVVIKQDLKFQLYSFMDSEDISCARQQFPCMHVHTDQLPPKDILLLFLYCSCCCCNSC